MTIISISLSDAEAEIIKAQASAEGVSVSQHIRSLCKPGVTKIKKYIREGKTLPKSITASVMCSKKEKYVYEDYTFYYIYEANHVFIYDGTLHPICPGISKTKASISFQSLLYAALSSVSINEYCSETLWQDVEKTFSQEIKITNSPNEDCCYYKIFIFLFERKYENHKYKMLLVDRDY